MLSTTNGCTCFAINMNRDPKELWKTCISCRGRAKAIYFCKSCGVGLYNGNETEHMLCTACYYND